MTVYEKPDFWALKAQKENYPARSVYKLKELDEKFSLLTVSQRNGITPLQSEAGGRPGLRVLDLGAAPGSWSLYILRRWASQGGRAAPAGPAEKRTGFLAASDLLPLSRRFDGGLFDGEHFFFIQGDFTAPFVREELERRGPYTALLSDAAPATTGSRTVDTLRSCALAEEALGYAGRCLAPGGNLAVKVFQGGGTEDLFKEIKDMFTAVKRFKPSACRANSFETYYIGLGKKGKV